MKRIVILWAHTFVQKDQKRHTHIACDFSSFKALHSTITPKEDWTLRWNQLCSHTVKACNERKKSSQKSFSTIWMVNRQRSIVKATHFLHCNQSARHGKNALRPELFRECLHFVVRWPNGSKKIGNHLEHHWRLELFNSPSYVVYVWISSSIHFADFPQCRKIKAFFT